jgi:uncharacterized Zn finger protein (UPF0148 family)
VPEVQRAAPTRLSAVACPSCGIRRVLPGTVYCDQCGKRIPDRLIKKLKQSEAPEPQEESGFGKTATAPSIATLPLRDSEPVGASARVERLSDSIAKRKAATTARGQEMRQSSTGAPPGMLWSRQRVLGASLIAFGICIAVASTLIGVINLSGLGLASFLIGLLLVYLNSGPSFTPELVEASTLSSLANVERVLHELGPETKAVYLKIRDRLSVPMVFIPLEENPAPPSELSLADEDRFLIIDSNDAHKTGLLFEAPGASLLALMEKESGVNFIDLTQEGFLDQLRSGMVESLEVAADVKATLTPERVKLQIRDGALRGLAQSVARLAPNVASRLGCPICSAAICATVKAVKSDMILEEAAHQPGSHTVNLSFVRGAINETT